MRSQFTYTGRELDEESGIYYYRARYYDPNIGRFLQEDPDPGTKANPLSVINKYVYASNAPTMFTDPTGKFLEIGSMISGLIGGFRSSLNSISGSGALGNFTRGLMEILMPQFFNDRILAAQQGVSEWAGREGYAFERKYLADEPYNLLYNISDSEDYHNVLNTYMNIQTLYAEGGSILFAGFIAVTAPGPGSYLGAAMAVGSIPRFGNRINDFIRNPRNDTWRNRTLLDHGIGAYGVYSNTTPK